MPEPEVHNRAGDPIEKKHLLNLEENYLPQSRNRVGDPIDLKAFVKKPAIIHALLNKPRPMPAREGKITRRPTEFPPTQSVTQTTISGGSSSSTTHFSFELEDDSSPTVPSVIIKDGEINGETPIGMGTDEYNLTGLYDGCFINCIITYDSDTLEITSTTFAVAADVPDSSLGVLYIEIGRVYFDYNVEGHVVNFTAVNTQCGDINFQFVYGALNGQPAVLPVAVYGDWVAVPVP